MTKEDIEKLRNGSMENLRKRLTDIKNYEENIYNNGYIVIADEYTEEPPNEEDYKIHILKKKEYFIYRYLKENPQPATEEILLDELDLKIKEIKDGTSFLIKQKLIDERLIETEKKEEIKYYRISNEYERPSLKLILVYKEKQQRVDEDYMIQKLNAKQIRSIKIEELKKSKEEIEKSKEEIKKLKEDINELESKTYGNILVFLGIFISIFSLISININFLDILKDLNMYEKISLISVVNLVTVISISALIGLIEIVKRPKAKDSKYPIWIVIGIIIILSLIFITATLLVPKENKEVSEKTEPKNNIYTIEVTGKIDKEIINILEKLNGRNNIKIVPKENEEVSEKIEPQNNIKIEPKEK